jgi:hypothetical protein
MDFGRPFALRKPHQKLPAWMDERKLPRGRFEREKLTLGRLVLVCIPTRQQSQASVPNLL